MLQFIREKTSGVIALVIVALLIVTFAFWGVSYYFDQGGDVVAVSVNDADIELFEYQRNYQNVRKRWQGILKDDIGSINDDLVKEQTLDSLIEQELINQLSDDLNLRVSAEQVRDLIGGIQVFQGVNGFDNSMYERSVAQLGYTTLMFEQQIQEDIKADQIQSSLSESAFVTDGEVKLLAGLTNQSRDVSYSIISSNELKESLQISDEAIAEFYEQNSRDYLEPEQVKIAYVEMSLKRMAVGLEVSEEDIRGYYETNKADYNVDDQRKIRHLTIRTGENATPERLEQVTGKAEELLSLLKSGISFQQLSEKHNNDIDFDIEISDLGFLTKGIMSAEIDELMFSLEEGAISEPIIGKESVDLIKVEKIKGGKKNTFENVRKEVTLTYSLSLAENKFFEASDQLANLAYEHPDTLEVAAEDLKLEIRESDYFNRNSQSDPVLSDKKIIAASFSAEILNGNNSEVIGVGKNRIFVLRLVDHISEKKKPLEEVRDRVITRMKYEQASKQIREEGESLLEMLKSGTSSDQLTDDDDIEWKHFTDVKRDNTGVNRSVLRTAFKLGRPDEGESAYTGISLDSGDYALVIVKSVNEPDPSSFSSEELATIKTQLEQMKSTTDWRRLMKDLRAQAEINIFSDRL